jgi:hypothetical protein
VHVSGKPFPVTDRPITARYIGFALIDICCSNDSRWSISDQESSKANCAEIIAQQGIYWVGHDSSSHPEQGQTEGVAGLDL